MGRFLLLLVCSACGLLAAGVHIWLTGGKFYSEYSAANQLDRDLIFMVYFTENWTIFYGVIYGLGQALGRRLLDPEDLEQMAAERRWYYPALLAVSGSVTITAHLVFLDKKHWLGWSHWVYVLVGGTLVLWGLAGLWSWWQHKRRHERS